MSDNLFICPHNGLIFFWGGCKIFCWKSLSLWIVRTIPSLPTLGCSSGTRSHSDSHPFSCHLIFSFSLKTLGVFSLSRGTWSIRALCCGVGHFWNESGVSGWILSISNLVAFVPGTYSVVTFRPLLFPPLTLFFLCETPVQGSNLWLLLYFFFFLSICFL